MSNKELKIGEFLVENGVVSNDQLQDALDMQKHNSDRLLGEILVTQGILTREQLIMSVEMYMMVTGVTPEQFSEWLDQEEVDMLLDKISDNTNNEK